MYLHIQWTSRTAFKPPPNFDGDLHDDILWYGFGTAPDYLWQFTSLTTVTSTPLKINGHYDPQAGDLTGDGADDLLWYAPGTSQDYVWDFDPGGQRTSQPLHVQGSYQPVVGSFGEDRTDDVLWYGVGSEPDYFWDFTADPPTRSATARRRCRSTVTTCPWSWMPGTTAPATVSPPATTSGG